MRLRFVSKVMSEIFISFVIAFIEFVLVFILLLLLLFVFNIYILAVVVTVISSVRRVITNDQRLTEYSCLYISNTFLSILVVPNQYFCYVLHTFTFFPIQSTHGAVTGLIDVVLYIVCPDYLFHNNASVPTFKSPLDNHCHVLFLSVAIIIIIIIIIVIIIRTVLQNSIMLQTHV